MKKKITRSLFLLIGIVITGYCLTSAALYANQEKFIFPGAKITQKQYAHLRSLPVREISLQVDGITLHGWHLNAGQGKPMVFYFGGNGDNLVSAIESFAALDSVQAVMVSYRGYGLSSGEPSEAALYSDSLHVFDYFVRKWQPDRRLVVGRSLGTGVASYLASQRRVDALALITPFDSTVSIGQARFPLMPVDLLMKHRFESVGRAHLLTMPTIVFKAEVDPVVPHQFTDQLVEKLPAVTREVLVAGTGHNNISSSPEYVRELFAFLLHHADAAGTGFQKDFYLP
jgi:pimeloyl-ACP methyl ester carboxylesterase